LLDETIELEREALSILPGEHSDRAAACVNLAQSLKHSYEQTGSSTLLNEAIELEREALDLLPEGHPGRAVPCEGLARSLQTRFNQTGEATLLDEARILCTQALEKAVVSPSHHVSLRVLLARIHLHAAYSSHSPPAAIAFLVEAIRHRAGLIPNFYSISDTLRVCTAAAVSDEDNERLLGVYQAIVEVLPEFGSVVLDKTSRLHRWREAGNLPLDALLHALKASELHTGLELLEQGRAVLWSQTLAMQGPQLRGLTDDRKTRLQTLLQSMGSSAEFGGTQHPGLTARDQAHASYNQLQLLLQEIRASPGLERFMRAPSYPELAQVASAHPVIILAADDTACHALIVSSVSASPIHLILDHLAASDIEHLGAGIRGLDLNVRSTSGVAVAKEARGMSISGRRQDPTVRKFYQALRRLWAGVVKPIFDCLGLKVCNLSLLAYSTDLA
jgi:hypothetical protein